MVERHKDFQKSAAFTDCGCPWNFSLKLSLSLQKFFFLAEVIKGGMNYVKCTWWFSGMHVGM